MFHFKYALRSTRARLNAATAFGLVAVGFVQSADAITTWNVSGGVFNTAGNWNNGAPTNTSAAVFTTPSAGGTAQSITLSGTPAGTQYFFNDNATGKITISTNTLGFRAGTDGGTVLTVSSASGDHEIQSGVQLQTNDNQVWDIATGRTFTMSGIISGTATQRVFSKSGSGTLRITNTANSYGSTAATSGMVVNAGTVSVTEVDVIGASSLNVTLNGGTLAITAATGTAASTKDYIIGINGGAIHVASGINASLGSGGTSRLNLNGNTFTKTGAGTFLFTQAAANSVAGAAVNVAEGTLRLGNTNVLPTTTALTLGTPSSAISGAVNINGNSQTITSLAVAGTGTNNRIFSSATGGLVTLNQATSTNSNFSGILGLASNDGFGLTKSGDGSLILSGANTYTGATSIGAGVVNIRSNTALGTTGGNTSVAATGAALEIQGGITSAEPLSLIGSGISTGGALRNISGDNSVIGAITLGTGGARVNSDADTLTLTGGITGTGLALTVGGAGSTTIGTTGINTSTGGTVTKDGNGILTISAGANYTGTTSVNAGVLLVNGTHTGGGAYTVQSGATLGGTGATASVVMIELGGKIAPGASIEDFGTGNLDLQAGSIFEAEVNFDVGAGSTADQIDVTGTVDLGNGSSFPELQFVATFAGDPITVPTTFLLIDNNLADTLGATERFAGGTVVTSPPNATHAFDYIVGMLKYRVSYNATFGGGDGNDVVVEFNQVPEPSSAIILGAVGLGLAARRRRSM